MIEVKDLEYFYPHKEEAAVDGISFSVGRGEIFGFLGPSGAGKSTTQNILIKLLSRYKGGVRVFGKDLRRQGRDYFERVGVSFELPNHYSRMTALENLRFFARMYQSDTDNPQKLLAMVELQSAASQKVGNFSKGMKMRLNFARALLPRPELLFLDEPTSGLDPGNARRIKDIILNKKREGCTIFVTTHNMHDAEELCDRVGFMVDGRLALVGSPKELKLSYGRRLVRVEASTQKGAGAEQETREFPLDDLGSNLEFLSYIKENRVETIHSLETTLEDIFLRTTGKRLI